MTPISYKPVTGGTESTVPRSPTRSSSVSVLKAQQSLVPACLLHVIYSPVSLHCILRILSPLLFLECADLVLASGSPLSA